MENQSLLIAQHLVSVAKDNEIIDDTGLLLIPELAEVEKKFFIDLFLKIDEYTKRQNSDELTLDEISSIFSFVFAKSAEAVTNHVNKSEQKFDYLGIFDGKIPVYVDETLMGELKDSKLPMLMAEAFLGFMTTNTDLNLDPKLSLLEALKWTWRFGQHFSATFLELYI